MSKHLQPTPCATSSPQRSPATWGLVQSQAEKTRTTFSVFFPTMCSTSTSSSSSGGGTWFCFPSAAWASCSDFFRSFYQFWKDAAEFHAGGNGFRRKPSSKRETHNFGDFSSPPSCSQLERQPGDQIVRGNGAKQNDVPTKRFH